MDAYGLEVYSAPSRRQCAFYLEDCDYLRYKNSNTDGGAGWKNTKFSWKPPGTLHCA